MKKIINKHSFTVGMAIFSIFFGAGNFALPIFIGTFATKNTPYSFLGFIPTAIIMPTIGLIAMLTFKGNYRLFLERIGKIPGFILMTTIITLIGPIGALPRAISLSYTTLTYHNSSLSFLYFAIISGILIFFFSVKKNRIIEYIGNVLTPVLLVLIFIIIIVGLVYAPPIDQYHCSRVDAFQYGFSLGPQTLDLFGAFFFAILIYPVLERIVNSGEYKYSLFYLMIQSTFLGMFFLTLVYAGLSLVSSHYHQFMGLVLVGQELSALSCLILGNNGGLIESLAVCLACLTTAIALTVVFSEFLKKDILQNKVPYPYILIFTITVSMFFAGIGFQTILEIIAPCLNFIYPAAFVLSICNLLYHYLGFKMVKIPFYLTLLTSLFLWLYQNISLY